MATKKTPGNCALRKPAWASPAVTGAIAPRTMQVIPATLSMAGENRPSFGSGTRSARIPALNTYGDSKEPLHFIAGANDFSRRWIGLGEVDLQELDIGPHPDPAHPGPIARSVVLATRDGDARATFRLSQQILMSADVLQSMDPLRQAGARLLGRSP